MKEKRLNPNKGKKESSIYKKYVYALIITLFGSKICGIIALYNLKKMENKEPDYNACNRRYAWAFKTGVFFVCLRLFFVFIFILGLVVTFNQSMNRSVII